MTFCWLSLTRWRNNLVTERIVESLGETWTEEKVKKILSEKLQLEINTPSPTLLHIVCNKRRFELLLQLNVDDHSLQTSNKAFLPRELLLLHLHLCIFDCIYVSFTNSICYPVWWEEAAVWWAPGFGTFYGHAKSVEGNVSVAVLWAEGLLSDLQAWTRLYCLVYPRHLKKKHKHMFYSAQLIFWLFIQHVC